MSYLASHIRSRRATTTPPQTQPSGSATSRNNAGGYVCSVPALQQLRRFLVLGSEGGTYYATEAQATYDNIACVDAVLAVDGVAVVDLVVEVSRAGLAAKQSPALFTLAKAISCKDLLTRLAAKAAVPVACRTASHLFEFVSYAIKLRGWGRCLKSAVASFYDRDPRKLAYQVTKYRSRNGLTHRDLLRLTHRKPDGEYDNRVQAFAVGKPCEAGSCVDQIAGLANVERATTVSQVVESVYTYDLPRECVPTKFLTEPDVWRALLLERDGRTVRMPYTAMLRNLGVMTSRGLLVGDSVTDSVVAAALTDEVRQAAARVHPLNVLLAGAVYGSGHGMRGSLSWTPSETVSRALESAFYSAFRTLEPTGKSLYVAVDVSGSMSSGNVAGVPLTPREAASAFSMSLVETEQNVYVAGFSRGNHFYSCEMVPMPFVQRGAKLADVISMSSKLPMGATDCAQPILDAIRRGLYVDAFVILTDSETWAGPVHVQDALKEYRRLFNPSAKLVAVAFTATSFSVADASDPGQLDVVGFDAAAPALIQSFVRGDLD